jgi:hypothetical protein
VSAKPQHANVEEQAERDDLYVATVRGKVKGGLPASPPAGIKPDVATVTR